MSERIREIQERLAHYDAASTHVKRNYAPILVESLRWALAEILSLIESKQEIERLRGEHLEARAYIESVDNENTELLAKNQQLKEAIIRLGIRMHDYDPDTKTFRVEVCENCRVALKSSITEPEPHKPGCYIGLALQ